MKKNCAVRCAAGGSLLLQRARSRGTERRPICPFFRWGIQRQACWQPRWTCRFTGQPIREGIWQPPFREPAWRTPNTCWQSISQAERRTCSHWTERSLSRSVEALICTPDSLLTGPGWQWDLDFPRVNSLKGLPFAAGVRAGSAAAWKTTEGSVISAVRKPGSCNGSERKACRGKTSPGKYTICWPGR